jgi:hypothetical protein
MLEPADNLAGERFLLTGRTVMRTMCNWDAANMSWLPTENDNDLKRSLTTKQR